MKNLNMLVPAAPTASARDYWTWGTVTADGGVILDGDTSATTVGIVDMIGIVDDTNTRVRCHVQGNRINVVGRLGGASLPSVSTSEMNARPARTGDAMWQWSDPAIRVSDGRGAYWRVNVNHKGDLARRDLVESWMSSKTVSNVGQTFWREDTKVMEVWTGSSWLPVGPFQNARGGIGDTRGMIGTTGYTGSGWNRVTPLGEDEANHPTVGGTIGANGASFEVTETGLYLVQGCIKFAGGAGDRVGISFDVANVYNDPYANFQTAGFASAPTGTAYQNGSMPMHVTAGKLIRMWAYSTNSVKQADSSQTWFRATRIG